MNRSEWHSCADEMIQYIKYTIPLACLFIVDSTLSMMGTKTVSLYKEHIGKYKAGDILFQEILLFLYFKNSFP